LRFELLGSVELYKRGCSEVRASCSEVAGWSQQEWRWQSRQRAQWYGLGMQGFAPLGYKSSRPSRPTLRAQYCGIPASPGHICGVRCSRCQLSVGLWRGWIAETWKRSYQMSPQFICGQDLFHILFPLLPSLQPSITLLFSPSFSAYCHICFVEVFFRISLCK
jgi:hypothetical protein